MKAVIVANGAVDAADRGHAAGADLVIAADGGALHLESWGITPAVVVGDMDSLEDSVLARLASQGARIERHPVDKDESDLELALATAIGAGARAVTVLGAFGARIDYTLANALLLADERWSGTELRALRGATVVRPLRGPGRIWLEGAVGDLVSLLPLGTTDGITTGGLRYPLSDATLNEGPSRGVSNRVTALPAWVRAVRGTLLIVESPSGGG